MRSYHNTYIVSFGAMKESRKRPLRDGSIKAAQIVICCLLVLHLLFGSSAGQELDPVHVNKTGSMAPYGAASDPYHSVEAAIVRTQTWSSHNVEIGAGKYYETFTISVPSTIRSSDGDATIGRMDYQSAVTLDIVTLNTHLFGDQGNVADIFEDVLWNDYERADDIADFFTQNSFTPDVAAFQEIWDQDLFRGGDGANGILPRSGYSPYGDHGDEINVCILFGLFVCEGNSGLALMSRYRLQNFVQRQWAIPCSPFPPPDAECLTAKGWVQATIEKQGFSVGLFNLHTHAANLGARSLQLQQLAGAVNAYQLAHPGHAVFVMGDFNVYGESNEYYLFLEQSMGNRISGGKDAARNRPGFILNGFESNWTYCLCNPLASYFDGTSPSGRLDYIFYVPSLDGTVEILPVDVRVIPFTGRVHAADRLSTDQSSDHWAVYGKFKLIRL